MATQTTTPPVQPPVPHDPHDEFTGAFGFFRKYQKYILYTAVLFALITFSVTGAMLGFFDKFRRGEGARPTITLMGKTVNVENEDMHWGAELAQGRYAPLQVLPQLASGSAAASELSRVYAILRRASLTEGLDVSETEVDRAIDAFCRSINEDRKDNKVTPTQIALMRTGSLAEYRAIVKEAMRIGNYVRLQSLAIDATEAALVDSILAGQEKITLRVATFDTKALQEQLKTAGGITEEALHKYLDDKDDIWKAQHQVLDSNHVALQVGACDIGAFKEGDWVEELKEFLPKDEVLTRMYEQFKERYKIAPTEPNGAVTYKPATADDVRAELKKIAQAEDVMNGLLRKLRDQRGATTKDLEDQLKKANEEKSTADIALGAAKKKAAAPGAAPADQTDLADRQKAFDEKKAAADVAQKALEAVRVAFDFGKAFTDLTKDKTGFLLVDVPPKTGTDAGPLGAEALGEKFKATDALGEWSSPTHATATTGNGELCSQVESTAKTWFLFKVTDWVKTPLKAWDKLKPVLETEYYVEQATKQAEEKKTAFAAAILRLAKEKIADKVTEIEGKKQGEIDKRFTEWETKTQADHDQAEQQITKATKGLPAYDAWVKTRNDLAAQLAKKEDKKKEIADAVAKENDNEVKAEAKKHYGEVLEAAAKEGDFKVVAMGPYFRQLTQDPSFIHMDDAVQFLFRGSVNQMKEGDATEVLQDFKTRNWHLAVCDKVEKRTAADLRRAEFVAAKEGQNGQPFVDMRVAKGLEQSFSFEALKKRYSYKDPQEVAQTAAGTGKPDEGKK